MTQPSATAATRQVPRDQSVTDGAIDKMLAGPQPNAPDPLAKAERLDSAPEFYELSGVINDIRLFARCAELAQDSAINQTASEELELQRWAVETLARWGSKAEESLNNLESLIAKQCIRFQRNAKTEA